jgi:hypothetical protein
MLCCSRFAVGVLAELNPMSGEEASEFGKVDPSLVLVVEDG